MSSQELMTPSGVLDTRPRGGLAGIALCLLLLAVATSVAVAADRLLHVQNVLLVFLPVILFAAVRYGFRMALASAVLSIASSSYFLADPLLSFAVSDAENIWALLFFLVVAGFTSTLAAQLRRRGEALRESVRVTEALYRFSSTLSALSEKHELLRAAAAGISATLEMEVLVLVPREGSLVVEGGTADSTFAGGDEAAAANWCWQRGRAAGRGTSVFGAAEGLYLPLETGRGTVGVLGLYPGQDWRGELAPGEAGSLVDSLRSQLAANLERVQLAEEMQESQLLRETDKLRTALLTAISHDLKTPLSSILGNITSLQRYGTLYDAETRNEMLQLAEAETVRLSRFVDNLLHMTRIDAGALHPTIEMVDVSDLVGSALKRTEKQLQDHTVSAELPPDLPMIIVDFVLAEHVLVNLLDNAAKHTPPGTKIRISARADGGQLVIDVMDEGPGIPESDQSRIFDRFFRARMADHRPAGSGLGLAICRGFVEAMGGRIRAANRTDRPGACFTVTLPGEGSRGDAGR